MRVSVWRAFLAFAAVAVPAYLLAPASVVWKGDLCFDLFGALSVAVITYGIVRNRPVHRLPWLLFALGQGLFVVGDAIFSLYDVLGVNPFPSAADGVYLAAYPILGAGVAVLVRRRRPGQDWAALLDAAIVTVGLGSVSWAVLMAPYTRDRSLSLPALGISLAYPLADVLLLAVAARLLFGGGKRSFSLLLIGFSLASLLITDTVYGWLSLHGRYASGDSVDVGWMVSYALFGAAALHPSMGEVSARFGDAARRFPIWRLAAVAAALGTAPAALAADGRPLLDRSMLGGAALALIVLAVVRLGGVIRAKERAIGREAVLRRTASALVRAGDSKAVAAATVEATFTLAGAREALALLAFGPPERLTIVAAAGCATDLRGQPLRLAADVRSALRRSSCVASSLPLLPSTGAAPVTSRLCPLILNREFGGVLARETPTRRVLSDEPALEVLAAQATLALESINLAEEGFRRRAEQRFRSLVRNSTDLIIVVDPELTIRYVAPSLEATLGYPESACLGRSLVELAESRDASKLPALVANATGPSGVAARELRLLRSDGGNAVFEVTASNQLSDPDVAGIVITARDVSVRRHLEAQLRRNEAEDGLTRLANGEVFRDRLQRAFARGDGARRQLAVVFVDMDDFGDVNESLGHAVGDSLLVEAARRIRSTLGAGDTGARIGGDEFAVLAEHVEGAAAARALAERVRTSLAQPYTLAGTEIVCSASAGVALAQQGSPQPDRLIQQAEIAMQRAKRNGKGRSVVFTPAMEKGLVDRLKEVGDLRHALDRREIVVYYQPIVNLRTGSVVGLEALARWQHPERGLLVPDQFIPLAEETGLIVPLGRFVLGEACRQARAWQEEQVAESRPWVSVNLSARELQQPSIRADIGAALASSGLDPGDLVLELEERAVASDSDAMIAIIDGIKRLGVRVAIDDFGTGHTALGHLRELPVDILKIDRGFLVDLDERPNHGQVVDGVIELAHTLGLEVIAGGIGQAEEAARLRALDCRLAQGALYAPPLDPQQIATFLAPNRVTGDKAA
jgi:diguanylate cyclase (GGDEF)-like protein/PAS domain S-box-containing protein